MNVGLLYLFVPSAGALGAGAASAVANVATGALVLTFARAYFGLRASEFLVLGPADARYIMQSGMALMRKRH